MRFFFLQLYLAIGFVLLSLCTKGQANLPPAYNIINNTIFDKILPPAYYQVLENNTGKWTLPEVSQAPLTEKFHSVIYAGQGLNYSIHTYWLRYRIRNTTGKEIKICLLNSTHADRCDFYVSDASLPNYIQHYVNGYLYPWTKKDGLKKIDAIPITIKPEEEKFIYNRIQNSYYFGKPDSLFVQIGSTETIIKQNYIDNDGSESNEVMLSALFAGVLLCSIFANFFFYLTVKEKSFFYYVLFLIYFSYYNYIDFLSTTVFTYSSPAIVYTIEYLINMFGITLFSQFLRHFLKTFNSYPKLDKQLQIVSVLSPLAYLIDFLVEPHLSGALNGLANSFGAFFFDLGLVVILITLLFYIKSKKRLYRMLVIAALPSAIIWQLGFTVKHIYSFLGHYYKLITPSIVYWFDKEFDKINMLGVMWMVISFSWILILRFMQLRKENTQQAIEKERMEKEREVERNALIQQQKAELEILVAERTADLKQSLANLKATQAQLILSEKMASLGELTAGIAHEIQNPLNFVNNFSEVSNELLDEMKEELNKGDIDEAKFIANDIKQNLEKINQHGKRADAIVKGMLEHSRTVKGEKQATNINALAEEYLRLAYHGIRAKNKLFNSDCKTYFDESIGKIHIVPQDIGRVLLNLYNNAFYAVDEKKKQLNGIFEPEIIISTKKFSSGVQIQVKDNGNGIPEKNLEKIFQPFFTTKPTGQGTGLGLSLSYDIIKAHGGEIKVTTKEGEGTEFIVILPT